MSKRALLPFLFAAIIAGTAGCKNSTTPAPAPTVSPSPSPTAVAYLPLAVNNTWNYTCTGGGTASKVITAGTAGITGVTTFSDTTSVTGPITASIASNEATDAAGNTLVYQWSLPGTTTTTAVNPAGLEYAANPTTGQTSTFPGPVAGTITMAYQGPQAPITNASGTWNAVVMFQFTFAGGFTPAPPPRLDYMVKGTGPVRIVFPVTPAITCDLATFKLN